MRIIFNDAFTLETDKCRIGLSTTTLHHHNFARLIHQSEWVVKSTCEAGYERDVFERVDSGSQDAKNYLLALVGMA